MCCPSPTFQPKGWYPVTVPTTVVSALVKHKVLPDPTFGMNLRQIPGVTYPIGANFSNIAMAPDSPYLLSWWYRKTFVVPAELQGQDGVAELSRNQLPREHLAERETDREIGRCRRRLAHLRIQRHRRRRSLARRTCWPSQVFAPTETDLAITFVDWNPAPPDKNMGLWREGLPDEPAVRSRCAIRRVVSHVDASGNAQLTVTALLKNRRQAAGQGHAQGQDRQD